MCRIYPTRRLDRPCGLPARDSFVGERPGAAVGHKRTRPRRLPACHSKSRKRSGGDAQRLDSLADAMAGEPFRHPRRAPRPAARDRRSRRRRGRPHAGPRGSGRRSSRSAVACAWSHDAPALRKRRCRRCRNRSVRVRRAVAGAGRGRAGGRRRARRRAAQLRLRCRRAAVRLEVPHPPGDGIGVTLARLPTPDPVVDHDAAVLAFPLLGDLRQPQAGTAERGRRPGIGVHLAHDQVSVRVVGVVVRDHDREVVFKADRAQGAVSELELLVAGRA